MNIHEQIPYVPYRDGGYSQAAPYQPIFGQKSGLRGRARGRARLATQTSRAAP